MTEITNYIDPLIEEEEWVNKQLGYTNTLYQKYKNENFPKPNYLERQLIKKQNVSQVRKVWPRNNSPT